MRRWTWALAGLGAVAVLGALYWAHGVVISRSDAVLNARHPKPPSMVIAATTAQALAQGQHLTMVTACAGCHGPELTGRMLTVAGSSVYAPNLTLVGKRLADGDLDRAIRRGLRPSGAAELAMPAEAYAALSDEEAAAVIGYLRGLTPKGSLSAQPTPGLVLRADLLAGVFKTALERLAAARPPLDAGPRVEAGRHLAAIACGRCHGTDLGGGRGLPGPDMTVRGYFDRDQFRTLMRTGEGLGEGDTALMSDVARTSFSHFSDGEIDSLYAYLDARDRILSAQANHRAGP